MLLHSRARRRGAHLVECAFVFSILMVLMIGLLVCSMGVFRYQQVAYLAREAARYAAVHGGQYQQENAAAITANTLPNVNSDYILKNVVQANAVNLDSSSLSVTVNFNTSSGATAGTTRPTTGIAGRPARRRSAARPTARRTR
jgi:Flp pilus assembly protein TadG